MTHPVAPGATSPYIIGQSSPPPPSSDTVSVDFAMTTQVWTLEVYPTNKCECDCMPNELQMVSVEIRALHRLYCTAMEHLFHASL